MQLALISNYLPSGSKIGVGYQVHGLANGLAERGHEVTVLSRSPATDGASYKTETLAIAGSLRTFRFATELRKRDFSGFDILHAHGDDQWLKTIPKVRRARAHVRTMHGSCLDEAIRISGAKEKLRMLALGLGEELSTVVADRTILVSPGTRRWMPWVPKENVIPNGIPTHFTPGGERAGRPTILFVGTYGQRKRGRLLMDVFADEVLPRVPDARLEMVCGDAPAARNVTVHGRVSDADLIGLYQKAWVFCLPSSYEGFGIPYAEAMACGTPVVATPNPGADYVLDSGRAGVIAKPDDLGAALVRVLTDCRHREGLAAAAAARAPMFSMDSVLDRYEAVYDELLAGR